MKAIVIAAGVVVPTFALVLGLSAVSGSAPPAVAATLAAVCATTGPVEGLSAVAAGNARIVTAVAEGQVGSSGAVIAVMAGYTESGLRVLGNPVVESGGVATQGVGANLDSVGIFQQRASWGTAAQRLDPVISTDLFTARLQGVARWQQLAPWVVAQEVQRSAYDGHPRAANQFSSVFGGNYRANYDLARRVVAQIDGTASQQSCGALSGGSPANAAPGSHGLPDGYTIPTSATPAEAQVVAFAIAQLDKPYVFDAAGPNAYDCSGLVMAAWATVGVALPHSSQAQAGAGSATIAEALVPGDLVLVAGDDGTLAAPGHVGLYIGDGLVLNAADERDGIRVQTFQNFVQVGHGLAALRHIG